MDVSGLLAQLNDARRIFIDSMIFVYALEDHPHYAPLSVAVLQHVESGRCPGVTSALTLAELLTAPARSGDRGAMRDYELYLTNFPHLAILPFTADMAGLVARLRATTGLRTPDAIQLAVARTAGCDVIVSNDRQWQGKAGAMRVVGLDG